MFHTGMDVMQPISIHVPKIGAKVQALTHALITVVTRCQVHLIVGEPIDYTADVTRMKAAGLSDVSAICRCVHRNHRRSYIKVEMRKWVTDDIQRVLLGMRDQAASLQAHPDSQPFTTL